MFMFTAKNLLRALDVAAMPARSADEMTPILCRVPIRFTDQGLIAVSTDRYQLVRTLAPYVTDAPATGAPEVHLHRDGIKMLLPVLKAAKNGYVTVEADAAHLTVTCEAQTITLENLAGEDGQEYPRIDSLFRLHQGENVALTADPFMAVNPVFLHSVTTVMKRYSERNTAVQFSLDRSNPAKPVAWMMGDWAHGVLMPVRMDAPRTRDAEMENGGGLARLFDAVTLPVPEVVTAEPQAAMEGSEPVPAGA
ncbi:hypothetical protein [Micrococcus luteus]|uniref:hypothetical protein n=1 Tax=Micrococcus luteus TaxID=1270 RepID=UPI000667D5B5|nr:hypothetical protein [Micrococcus luteus]MBN6750226.1 hypothetical protein [Micrococcus luteus]MBN6761135.1 hypothetical protein [Micrococcus luteus]MBN6801793.1 hypothetical protein [Micrococcus luteus]TKD49238.1 hypothetical protein FBF74_12110 [Micrococcus luteus]